jgi:hypothetical protein
MATIKVTMEIHNATDSTLRSIKNGILHETLEIHFLVEDEEIGEIDVVEVDDKP